MYVSDYTITTDNSIWPYSQTTEDKGLIIEDKIINHPYTTFLGTYSCYLIVKSSTSYRYDREVQKISSVFSFIGGLISAISAALFVFKMYNSFAFEITIALSIFKPSSQISKSVQKTSMNFFYFVKYHFYLLCRKIGRTPDWPNVSFIQ